MRRLPLRWREPVSVAVAIVVLVAAALGSMSAFRALQRRHVEVQALRAKVQLARDLQAEASSSTAGDGAQQAAYRQLLERRHLGSNLAAVVDSVGEQARRHRLELTGLQPNAAESAVEPVVLPTGLTLKPTPLAIRLQGRYRQIAEFLQAVTHESFLASVASCHLKPKQERQALLVADVTLIVYLAQPEAAPSTGGAS